MKIARMIVKAAEKKYGNARYEDIDTITASAEEWESIIAENLRKVRSVLNEEIDIPFYAYGENEAACRMASAIRAALKMLGEE